MKSQNRGFSIIEVLIFVSILSIFFVVATSVTIASLRNMKINEHKILAARYAEEAVEWLRDQKEADWKSFLTRASGVNWCFAETPINTGWTLQRTCNSSDYLIVNSVTSTFKRNVTLNSIGNPVSQVNINVTVSWQELGNTYQVPVKTVFTLWEQ